MKLEVNKWYKYTYPTSAADYTFVYNVVNENECNVVIYETDTGRIYNHISCVLYDDTENVCQINTSHIEKGIQKRMILAAIQ